MLRRNRKSGLEAAAPMGSDNREAITSILDANMRVDGNVHFSGKARIDGQVEGNISGGYLVLSETGSVVGDVDVEVLICHGRVEGDVIAQNLIARSSATISGTIRVQDISVESGAALNGEIKSVRPEPPAPNHSSTE
jgi:cytoskeletal protein CcmA (bactofilin family)